MDSIPRQPVYPVMRQVVGWVMASAYLLLSAVLFHQAMNCAEWLCDLIALPALFPFGFGLYWLIESASIAYPTSSGLPGDHLRSWYFIAPVVLVNAVFYYWAGRLLARIAYWTGKAFSKSASLSNY